MLDLFTRALRATLMKTEDNIFLSESAEAVSQRSPLKRGLQLY